MGRVWLAFHWEPYSLHPTIITAEGKVVTIISRDCCPYLDDVEPDYLNPAVAAVTPVWGAFGILGPFWPLQ